MPNFQCRSHTNHRGWRNVKLQNIYSSKLSLPVLWFKSSKIKQLPSFTIDTTNTMSFPGCSNTILHKLLIKSPYNPKNSKKYDPSFPSFNLAPVQSLGVDALPSSFWVLWASTRWSARFRSTSRSAWSSWSTMKTWKPWLKKSMISLIWFIWMVRLTVFLEFCFIIWSVRLS